MNPAEFHTLERAEHDLWWFQGMRQILFGMLDPLVSARKIHRVLEAGSGTGHMSSLLAQRYGWTMYPIDLAWEGISQTERSCQTRPAQADITACPFRDDAFDALVSLDVLVHLMPGAESGALREFARVLRPGGLLVLRVSALDILRSRHSEFTHERQRFTRHRLVSAARAAGFEILRCTYANALLLPVAFARFRIWEPLTRQAPASGTGPVPPWLNRALAAPLALEADLLSRGLNFPLGQSLILTGERTSSR